MLTLEKKIAGGYQINQMVITSMADKPVMVALCESAGAAANTSFFDLIPATDHPIIFVVDAVDSRDDDEVVLWRLKELTDYFAVESVAPGNGKDFRVYVLTSSTKIAEKLLTVNGGKSPSAWLW
jgi:hypothetical protein